MTEESAIGNLTAGSQGSHPGDPGRFSSARNFAPEVGSHVHPGSLGGYYIDFTIKTIEPEWPPPWMNPLQPQIHVAVAQWGLGCYERYLGGEGDAWLVAATRAAQHLVNDQQRGGPNDGAWLQLDAMPHTYRIEPPWASAMGQGEGASLLVRVHRELSEDRYAEAALRALRLLSVPVSEGGLRAPLGDGFFLEEYPTETPSLVLNGGIFALWGCNDVAVALDDAPARAVFDEGVAALAANLHRWDTGSWSRYDLYPFRPVNISSSAYHLLHTTQLRAMSKVVPDPEFTRVADRFDEYARSRRLRSAAFARKVAFRLAVPRNSLLAHRWPSGGIGRTRSG
jgi:heparosan-N-sulfate-glucuronate 5-epimerase